MALTPAQIAERKEQAEAAYMSGRLAVADIIGGDVPFGMGLFQHRFETACPYRAVAWGDLGHELPAWQRGYNDALAQHYGIKTVDFDAQPPGIREAMNGRDPNDGGKRINSFGEAVIVAATLSTALGVSIWPEDRGSNVSPRYACIRGFQIGEPVSYGFNGDSYIAGRIIDMSGKGDILTGYRIITTESHNGVTRKFWRRRNTGSWKWNETWTLIHGWHRDTNPEF